MKSLLHSYLKVFCIEQKPDIKLWAKIHNIVPLNAPLIDRCNYLKMPFNFIPLEQLSACKMPQDLSTQSLTYDECSEKRVNELLDLSKRLDKPITILYSGGIDSTFVVVSFLKYMSKEDIKDRVKIALSIDSIQENANFYYNHLRPNFNLTSSEPINKFYDKNQIVVSGQHNDQLIGSDLFWKIYKNNTWDRVFEPYSRDFWVDNFFKLYMNDDIAANHWYDLMDSQIKHACPCEVKTNYDFLWWYNFNYKWQSSYFSPLMCIGSTPLRSLVDMDFLEYYYIHFFSSHDFQKWAMLNHDLKIKDNDWEKYKWECRRLIYEYDGDEKYFLTKKKSGSLGNLLTQKRFPDALTPDFRFTDPEDVYEYYIPQNDFSVVLN